MEENKTLEELVNLQNKKKIKVEELEKWLKEHGPENKSKGSRDLSGTKEYEQNQEELQIRKKELDEIEKDIDEYKELEEKRKKLDLEKLKKEKKAKIIALKRTTSDLEKIDKNKDPKGYKELLEELEARNKELSDVINRSKESNKYLKRQIEILDKYKIRNEEVLKGDNNNKGAVNKKHEEKNAKSTENSEKSNNDNEKREYKKIEATQDELDRYVDLINKGYSEDSTEMLEFFKQVARDRGLRMNPIGSREKDGNLKYPLAIAEEKNHESKEEISNNSADTTLERDENGNLKYPPIEYQGMQLPQEKTTDTLRILYSGKYNTYTVMSNDSITDTIEGITFKNKKEKINFLKQSFVKEDLEYIFGDEKAMKKTMKKIAKKMDPQLIVLLSDKNMDYAKKYIKELSSKEPKKENLPYEMKYNLKGMKKNKKATGLSASARRKIRKMATRNKDVAEYIPDDKSRKWLIFPVVGALAAGGLAIANNNSKDKKPEDNILQHTDTAEPGTTAPEQKTENETTTTSTSTVSPQDIEDALKGSQNKEDLALGSRVKLEEGLTYTQDSLGNGASGEIGEVSWRPAGEYTIDRVALYHNGTLLANLGTAGTNVDEAVKNYAKKLGVAPSDIVQKAHICVGDKHNGATGWLKMNEISMQELKNNISKTYDELQQEKANKSNLQQTKNNAQQQSHEDR